MSVFFHVHPYMDEHVKESHPHVDEHCFSVTTGQPLTEKI